MIKKLFAKKYSLYIEADHFKAEEIIAKITKENPEIIKTGFHGLAILEEEVEDKIKSETK